MHFPRDEEKRSASNRVCNVSEFSLGTELMIDTVLAKLEKLW